ncbi:MAG: hypothetical protein HKN22_01845 [Bacteroidia bacterium]|nr:hypothetical protein [Bacteroidia bacterium]
MKKLILFIPIALLALYLTSCDDDPVDPVFEYHAHIHQPDNSDKHVGDTMHIHVDFESMTDMTVHHVNVRIYKVVDSTEIYNAPADAHVHATSGKYEWHDDFILSNTNGVMQHTDWILEAKVWGHEEDEELETKTVQFHVHP